jgi:hypothetical protein
MKTRAKTKSIWQQLLRPMGQPWLPTLILLSACASGFAQTSANEDHALTLRGFGTIGYARSSNDDAQFVRDLSQPTGIGNEGGFKIDSILGLQANYRASDTLEFVAQVVSHQRYNDSYAPELTWAFAKYDLNPRVSFRLGRIGTEFLMQSDSRMVGYSYLPVRPPVNFYAGVPINYGDGADVQLRIPMADGVLRGSLYLGVAREQLPPYDTSGSPIRAGSIGFDKGPMQLRLIHAESDLANSMLGLEPLRTTLAGLGAVSAANALDMINTRSQYDSVGVGYDDGAWQFQAALNRVKHGTVLTENSRAGYFSLAHRVDNFSPYAGYSWSKSSAKSLTSGLPGPAAAFFDPQIDAVLKRSHQDQQTRTLGLRWDFARNLDLKAQLDFVRGDPSSILLYNNVQPGWNGKTTVFSLALDFVF